ncbi:MAG: oxidoreductase [Gammaproteobacteria bacterium]|nr:oxidoreductase [Gammaproteobacteria bacterium]
MSRIILDGAITESTWTTVEAGADHSAANVLVTIDDYAADPGLQGRKDAGVWVAADDDIDRLQAHVGSLELIALHFPAFTDGRALSHATTLRMRTGYTGELRAIGDVRRDQIEQMLRCGINAFELPEGADVDAALDGLKEFSHSYQTSTNTPEPLFRKRS